MRFPWRQEKDKGDLHLALPRDEVVSMEFETHLKIKEGVNIEDAAKAFAQAFPFALRLDVEKKGGTR